MALLFKRKKKPPSAFIRLFKCAEKRFHNNEVDPLQYKEIFQDGMKTTFLDFLKKTLGFSSI